MGVGGDNFFSSFLLWNRSARIYLKKRWPKSTIQGQPYSLRTQSNIRIQTKLQMNTHTTTTTTTGVLLALLVVWCTYVSAAITCPLSPWSSPSTWPSKRYVPLSLSLSLSAYTLTHSCYQYPCSRERCSYKCHNVCPVGHQHSHTQLPHDSRPFGIRQSKPYPVSQLHQPNRQLLHRR